MHIVHLLQRRFPGRSKNIITVLVVVMGSAVLIGLGLLLLI